MLVVDDDARIRLLLAWRLEAEGLEVLEAADGLTALRSIEVDAPDLVLLDLNLPGIGGLDVLSRIRERGDLPVIVLTGRAGVTDRIVGLDIGADDYVIKPFSPAEVAARVRAVMRRRSGAAQEDARLVFGPLVIDTTTREVSVEERPVELTRLEFDLLCALAGTPRRAFRRSELLDSVWGLGEAGQGESAVTQAIHRLRRKLEADPSNPRWLRSVAGIGYRFEP